MKKQVLLLMTGLLFVCSGAFAQQEWKELVENGDFEGSGFSSFSIQDYRDGSSQDLTADNIVADDNDANNHCAKITLTITPRYCYFIIKLAEPLSEGDIFKFSMRAKTSSERDIPIKTENMGDIMVETGGEWNTFNYEGLVSSELAGSQAITLKFGLAPRKNDIFYFDDISMKVMDGNAHIEFADAKVKEICVSKWDTNGDGELSYAEAAAVTDSNFGYSFYYNGDITSFDEFQYFFGLTEIGGFRGCSNLNSIVLPCTAKIINSSAFEECTSLKTLVIPNSVMYIGQRSFAGCTGLTSIEIPNSVIELGRIERDNGTEVGGGTFENCSNLSTVVLSKNLKTLGGDIFKGCTSLSSLNIPKSVTWIIGNNVCECYNLTSIQVEEGNPVYDSRNNCNAIINTADNELISGCKTTIIPNSISNIGHDAFRGIKDLSAIAIPNSVVSIGGNAFSGCSGLTSLTIPNSVNSIGKSAFSGCDLTSITVESGNAKYDSRDDCNAIIETETNMLVAGSMKTIIPNSVTSIGEGAFSGCSLTSLTIPNSVTSIGDVAFFGCSLTSLTIPNSVISIGYAAFYGCSLTSLTIPNSVTNIGEYAFAFCSNLKTITIPNSVTSIGVNTFYRCTSLTSVTLPNSLTSIEGGAFSYCISLAAVTLPNSLTSIGGSAFYGCTGLTSITLPNSVTSIGDFAFYDCTSLTEVRSMITDPFEIDIYCWDDYNRMYIYNMIPLYVPVGTKEKYESTSAWNKFKNIVEMDIVPFEEGQTIDIGKEIDENTNLEGTVVDNVFVNISNGNGGFDPVEGCLIVSKPTDDSVINGKDIFGDDFKDNYTGIVFKVNEGKGSIKVEAETQGNMVLKVKIGNSEPIEMELDGKLKVKFPYDVSEETLVYIYGGLSSAGAKATGARLAPSATDLLKIYGFEIVSAPSGIDAIENGQQPDAPVYNLNGQRVNIPGKGIYIKNGRKVLVK